MPRRRRAAKAPCCDGARRQAAGTHTRRHSSHPPPVARSRLCPPAAADAPGARARGASSALAPHRYVESSFWNFDALYQPQQHPARDEHDTFFIKTPAATLDIPEDYLQRVKQTHENGGANLPAEYAAASTGWKYDWSEDVTRTQLLRTHTTAVSSRTLYALAQLAKKAGKPGEVLKPQKYFSIDRVFRNEALDATHLAEFHQVRLRSAASLQTPPAPPAPPPSAALPPPPSAAFSHPRRRRNASRSPTGRSSKLPTAPTRCARSSAATSESSTPPKVQVRVYGCT